MKCPICKNEIKINDEIACVSFGDVVEIIPSSEFRGEEIDFSPNDIEHYYHDNCFWIQPKFK